MGRYRMQVSCPEAPILMRGSAAITYSSTTLASSAVRVVAADAVSMAATASVTHRSDSAAIADYTRAIELDPILAEAYYNRSTALCRRCPLYSSTH